MTVLSPMLVKHSLALAERYLSDMRPVALPAEIVPEGPRAWYVLQTVARGETKMVKALDDLGFESYVPVMRKEVYRRRRLVEREFRLFNRYVFAHLPMNPRAWRTVRDVEEFDCVLGDHDGPCSVAEADIERFRAAEAAREFDDTKRVRFPIGSRVRAVAGPFGGFAGRVTSLTGKGVVEAMIEIFGRLTPVKFPYDMVEPE